MAERFAAHPAAIENTLAIAERCAFAFEKQSLHLPEFPVPEGYDLDGYFEQVARDGLEALMPELLCMVAPTVNSFTRLIPGFWAPTEASWGVDNRTCALRVITGSEKSQRVEFRIAAADANPYVILAAALASGLWGIENRVEPEEPVKGNAYEKKFPKRLALPRTLWEAAQALKGSKAARDWFGDAFVEHYAATREWEEREFRKHITDWEMERYFEII